MVNEGREVDITVRVVAIRDGTQGISISMPDRVVGEWTDSGARSLTITDEHGISIRGTDGVQRYLLTMPGTPVRGEQHSDTEATIAMRI